MANATEEDFERGKQFAQKQLKKAQEAYQSLLREAGNTPTQEQADALITAQREVDRRKNIFNNY
jgi:hypothetical protein